MPLADVGFPHQGGGADAYPRHGGGADRGEASRPHGTGHHRAEGLKISDTQGRVVAATWERGSALSARTTSAAPLPLPHPPTSAAREQERTTKGRHVRTRARAVPFLRPHDLEQGRETPYKRPQAPHDPTRAIARQSLPRQPFPTLCAHVTAFMSLKAAAYPSQILRNVCFYPGDGQSQAGDHTRG